MRSSCSPGDKPCLSPAPEADSVPGVPSGRRAGFCTPMVSVLSQGARCCGTSPKTPPPNPKPCRKSASGGKAGGRHTQRGTRPAPASPPASPKAPVLGSKVWLCATRRWQGHLCLVFGVASTTPWVPAWHGAAGGCDLHLPAAAIRGTSRASCLGCDSFSWGLRQGFE